MPIRNVRKNGRTDATSNEKKKKFTDNYNIFQTEQMNDNSVYTRFTFATQRAHTHIHKLTVNNINARARTHTYTQTCKVHTHTHRP